MLKRAHDCRKTAENAAKALLMKLDGSCGGAFAVAGCSGQPWESLSSNSHTRRVSTGSTGQARGLRGSGSERESWKAPSHFAGQREGAEPNCCFLSCTLSHFVLPSISQQSLIFKKHLGW